MRRIALVLVVCWSLSCAASPPLAGRPLVETRLFFGTQVGDREVSDAEWAGFLEKTVTPRFPEGLTVLEAYGQYRNAAGKIVRERSHVLLVLHAGAPEANRAIEEVVRDYKARFRQESVLRVDAAAGVTF